MDIERMSLWGAMMSWLCQAWGHVGLRMEMVEAGGLLGLFGGIVVGRGGKPLGPKTLELTGKKGDPKFPSPLPEVSFIR